MRLLRRRKFIIPAIAGIVALIGAGVAYAYFTSNGSGSGSAQVATTSNLVIDQLSGSTIYDSTIPPYGSSGPCSPTGTVGPSVAGECGYQWSYAYTATGANELGNEIQVSNPAGLPLGDVTVAMTNFTPASQSVALPITLNIWNAPSGSPANDTQPGSLIATDTVDVTPPGTITGGNPNTGVGSDDFNAVFDFSSQNVTLSDGQDIVYGIAYNDATVDTGLNVQLSYDQTGNPSVGSDQNLGWIFVSTADGNNDATGGPNGEITCQTVSSTFAEYSTALGSNCGLQNFGSLQSTAAGFLVPAVQFSTVGSTSGLYPGGPAQDISFSVTNPGSSSAEVRTVTISVAADGSGNAETPAGASILGCLASWFQINGSPVTVNQNIPPGQTIDWIAAASIDMPNNTTTDQSVCENKAVLLNFTSS